MNNNIEKILEQIATEENLSLSQVRGAVNHFFNWQRQALANKTHVAYNLQGFGKITHLNDRGENAIEADEYITKKRKKVVNSADYEAKDSIIQSLKTYNYKILINTKHQKLLIKHDKGISYLGFSYKKLIKKTLTELQELESFLKEHNKKQDGKEHYPNKND